MSVNFVRNGEEMKHTNWLNQKREKGIAKIADFGPNHAVVKHNDEGVIKCRNHLIRPKKQCTASCLHF